MLQLFVLVAVADAWFCGDTYIDDRWYSDIVNEGSPGELQTEALLLAMSGRRRATVWNTEVPLEGGIAALYIVQSYWEEELQIEESYRQRGIYIENRTDAGGELFAQRDYGNGPGPGYITYKGGISTYKYRHERAGTYVAGRAGRAGRRPKKVQKYI